MVIFHSYVTVYQRLRGYVFVDCYDLTLRDEGLPISNFLLLMSTRIASHGWLISKKTEALKPSEASSEIARICGRNMVGAQFNSLFVAKKPASLIPGWHSLPRLLLFTCGGWEHRSSVGNVPPSKWWLTLGSLKVCFWISHDHSTITQIIQI